MSAPLVVAGTGDSAETALAEAERDGYTRVDGFALPDVPWDVASLRLVCTGTVADEAAAAAAVLAATRGAGVVVRGAVRRDLLAALVDDLRRVRPVSLLPPPPQPLLARLDGEQRVLLGALAGGANLAEAARLAHVSRRTADRRLAAARAALGVETNAEAAVLAVRLGLDVGAI